MKGSKPTSPAYCCWRLGGRFKNGIAAEYLESGGAVFVLEGDDTMANGDVVASVMLLLVIRDDLLLLCYYYYSVHITCLFFAKAFQTHWWLVASCVLRARKGAVWSLPLEYNS